MKVLVCGGRDYDDHATLVSRLEEIHRDRRIAVIIEGGARGADALARRFGERRAFRFGRFRLTGERMAGLLALSEIARCLRKESPISLLPSPAGKAPRT
jgi:YspA, cpYpsA-related SLOG family